jgi:hypothetical protein
LSCRCLSPVIAFLLAMAAEIAICAVVDAGAPAVVVLGAGTTGLVLFRRLRPLGGASAET